MEFIENTKGTLTTGATFKSILKAMGSFEGLAKKYMKEEGLEDYIDDMRHWYPLQPWLNVLRKVNQKVGPNTMVNIGKNNIDLAIFKQAHDQLGLEVKTLFEAFDFINKIFHHNHKTKEGIVYYDFATPDKGFIDGLGSYSVSEQTETSSIIVGDTPFPEEFDMGIIITTSSYIYPNGRVTHIDDRDCKKKGNHSCSFLIEW